MFSKKGGDMDNSQNQSEIDPWGKIGNYGNNKEPSPENIERADEWAASMETAPEFNSQKNEIGDADIPEIDETEDANIPEEEYDETISGTANLLNYGLDGIARNIGVEQTMQALKNYDPSNNPSDPIKGFYESIGIDTTKEYKDIQSTNSANRDSVNEYLNNTNTSPINSTEHAIKALLDAHNLIRAIESSPEYASLRENAKKSEMGYFEYAIHDIPNAGLPDLFKRLEEMKDDISSKESIDETQSETNVDEYEDNEDKNEELIN